MFTDHRLVDLTLTSDERLPTRWPPYAPFLCHIWNWFDDVDEGPHVLRSHCGPYFTEALRIDEHDFTEALRIDEHVGTHFDAPPHFLAKQSRRGLIRKPAIRSRSVSSAAQPQSSTCEPVEERGADPEAARVAPGDVQHWEAQQRRMVAGDIVCRTAWDRYYTRDNGVRMRSMSRSSRAGVAGPKSTVCVAESQEGVCCVGIDVPAWRRT